MNRILLVGLGPLGQLSQRCRERGVARVVAAVDIDPAMIGKPVSAIVPESRFSPRAEIGR